MEVIKKDSLNDLDFRIIKRKTTLWIMEDGKPFTTRYMIQYRVFGRYKDFMGVQTKKEALQEFKDLNKLTRAIRATNSATRKLNRILN